MLGMALEVFVYTLKGDEGPIGEKTGTAHGKLQRCGVPGWSGGVARGGQWGARQGCERGLLWGPEDPSAGRGVPGGQGPVRKLEQRPGLGFREKPSQGSFREAAWVVGASTGGL